MVATAEYGINSYFKEGKSCAWAIYVDKQENGGNGDGYVNGKEIKLFQDIILHRYNYSYDFNRDNSEQETELGELPENLETNIAKHMYMKSDITQGAWLIGQSTSKELSYVSINYNLTKNAMEKIKTFPVENKKYELVKNFLSGYFLGNARNGFFEQLGHEYGKNFTNGEVVTFLKAIMDALPEDKKYTNAYGRVNEIYKEYSSKPQNEPFKDSKFSAISRIFSLNTLDQLDDAIEQLYSD